MSSSCSFRITRTTEDLANTLSLLSKRLVTLEQRQEAIESKLIDAQEEMSEEEIKILDGIDQLLSECQELLDTPSPNEVVHNQQWTEEENSASLAA